MDGIFISYRRDDAAGYAGRLYDRLAAHFGDDRVFMDVEGIEPGADFIDAIDQAVGSCRAMIVMIGTGWIQAVDSRGRRRLDDPNDFIRIEAGLALKRGIRVVPVLVDGAGMPAQDELPDDLKALTRRQAIEVSHKQWEATTAELIAALERILAGNGGSSASPPVRAAVEPPIARPRDQPAEAQAGMPGGATRATDSPPRRYAMRWIAAGGAAALMIAGAVFLGLRPTAPTNSSMTPAAPASPTSTPNVRSERAEPAATPAQVQPAALSPTQPAETPRILTLTAQTRGKTAKICFAVDGAEQLELAPRPGSLPATPKHCSVVSLAERTTFVLTARNGAGSAQRSIEVAPANAPEAAAGPAAADAAASGPTATERSPAAAETDPALPRKGESWTYRMRGVWPTSPVRTLEFSIAAVDGRQLEVVLAELTDGARKQIERRHIDASRPEMLLWPTLGAEFAPFMMPYDGIKPDSRWSAIPTPDLDPSWREWRSSGKVSGSEQVRVPAGSFEALKVELLSSRAASGNPTTAAVEPVTVRYQAWYPPSAKRYVKMVRVMRSASNRQLEEDTIELLAHRRP